jgi:hypothetical protein
MFYVLHPFVTYLLTLPHIMIVKEIHCCGEGDQAGQGKVKLWAYMFEMALGLVPNN